MLYDPKWEQKTKPDPFSLESVLAWLGQQDPNTTYEFSSWDDCAACRYLKANGMPVSDYWMVSNATIRVVMFNDYPMTYGAALERARRFTR